MPVMNSKNNFAEISWQWGVPGFALVMLLVVQFSGINIELFKWLNRSATFAGDSWWSYLTLFGDSTLILSFLLLLIGRRPMLAWQFVLAAIFASIITTVGKESFLSFRPPAVLELGSFHLIGPLLEYTSFPSGHTTTIFVLAGLVCMQSIRTELKWAMLFFATLVGLSRIACGVHWPVDVLGGMLGGWLSALLAVVLAGRWQIGLNVWLQRVVAALITYGAIWSMLYYDSGFPNTWLLHFLITAVCLGLSLKWQYRLFKFR